MDNISEENLKEARGEQAPEKSHAEIVEGLYQEKQTEIKEKEQAQEEQKRIREMLEREVDKIDDNPALLEEARKQGEQIKLLDTEGKIRRLLEITGQKGVVFAVGVAREMQDPYTLDVFHDLLAKEGLYKKFEK